MTIKAHAEEFTGFVVSFVTTPSFMLAGITTTLLQSAIVAILSGFLGAIAAHFGRRLVVKFKL